MIDTSNRLWLLVDNNHASWSTLMEELQLRHRAIWKKNRLSVTTSDEGALSLVKVAGGKVLSWQNQPHIQSLLSGGTVVRTYTTANHSEAVKLLSAPAWSRTNTLAEELGPPTSKWVVVRDFVRNLWNTWTSR